MKSTNGKPTCPACESKAIQYRKRLPHFWCRRCGWTENEPNYEVIVTCKANLKNEVTQKQGIIPTTPEDRKEPVARVNVDDE